MGFGGEKRRRLDHVLLILRRAEQTQILVSHRENRKPRKKSAKTQRKKCASAKIGCDDATRAVVVNETHTSAANSENAHFTITTTHKTAKSAHEKTANSARGKNAETHETKMAEAPKNRTNSKEECEKRKWRKRLAKSAKRCESKNKRACLNTGIDD